MGGRAPRRKGDVRERRVVKLLSEIGLEARRRPLSGADGFEGKSHDVDLRLPNGEWVAVEVKARARFAFQQWADGADLLVLVPDRSTPFLVVPWPMMEKLFRDVA